jgi:Asp-tRNA(Asn)/Glu-tRNA(Gln) amidotransferase A subunit family amidase
VRPPADPRRDSCGDAGGRAGAVAALAVFLALAALFG